MDLAFIAEPAVRHRSMVAPCNSRKQVTNYGMDARELTSPDKAYISISRNAGDDMRRLGVVPGESDFDELRRRVISALGYGGVKVDVESIELFFTASASVLTEDGTKVDCELKCVTRNGSPSGKQNQTTTILSAH